MDITGGTFQGGTGGAPGSGGGGGTGGPGGPPFVIVGGVRPAATMAGPMGQAGNDGLMGLDGFGIRDDGGHLTLYGQLQAAYTGFNTPKALLFSPLNTDPTFSNGIALITGTLENNTAPSTFAVDITGGGSLTVVQAPLAQAAVPEPSPLALLTLGALPLGLRAVKRRRPA